MTKSSSQPKPGDPDGSSRKTRGWRSIISSTPIIATITALVSAVIVGVIISENTEKGGWGLAFGIGIGFFLLFLLIVAIMFFKALRGEERKKEPAKKEEQTPPSSVVVVKESTKGGTSGWTVFWIVLLLILLMVLVYNLPKYLNSFDHRPTPTLTVKAPAVERMVITLRVCDEAWTEGDENYSAKDVAYIKVPPMKKNCLGRTIDLPNLWDNVCIVPDPLNPGPTWQMAFQFLDESGRVLDTHGPYGPLDEPRFSPRSRRLRFEGTDGGGVRLYPGGCY